MKIRFEDHDLVVLPTAERSEAVDAVQKVVKLALRIGLWQELRLAPIELDESRVQVPEVRLGLPPDGPADEYLARLICFTAELEGWEPSVAVDQWWNNYLSSGGDLGGSDP